MEIKTCIGCLNDKPISSFGKNKQKPGGYNPRCKICMLNGVKKHREPIITLPNDNNTLKLTPVTQQDYIDTYKFLENIGYDLKSPLSIHEQFCLKYGFEPKKRNKSKEKIYYSKEELFNFL